MNGKYECAICYKHETKTGGATMQVHAMFSSKLLYEAFYRRYSYQVFPFVFIILLNDPKDVIFFNYLGTKYNTWISLQVIQ